MKGKKSLSQDEGEEGEGGKTGHGDRANVGLRGGEIAPAYSTPKRSDDENISFNLEVKKQSFSVAGWRSAADQAAKDL